MDSVVLNMDCRDFLAGALNDKVRFPLIFADPPDNLGLAYGEYKDKIPKSSYYDMIFTIIVNSLAVADTFWLSYYWEHDTEIKYMVRNVLKFQRPTYRAKTFIWRYTFGQHRKSDFGSGFRYLLRFTGPGSTFNPDSVLERSERQRIGDSRANPEGRVPDDVWSYGPAVFDVPRVVGNAAERRPWHPTQHPEALISRIIRMHSNPGDTVVDLFGGTGTTIRAAKPLNRRAVVCEIDSNYAIHIAAENSIDVENQWAVALFL